MFQKQFNFNRLHISSFFKVINYEIEVIDEEGPWVFFISEMTFGDQVKKLYECDLQLIDSDTNHILLNMMS